MNEQPSLTQDSPAWIAFTRIAFALALGSVVLGISGDTRWRHTIQMIGLQIVACVFFTDFLSGFFHWLEDAYGHEDWPIVGDLIIKPNILHHNDCRYFTRHSWLYSARVLLGIGAVILLVAHLGGFLNWMTLLVVAIGVNANEMHKWAHRTAAENGKVITALQQLRILQSPAHHFVHHRGSKDTHYCVVTNYINPLGYGPGAAVIGGR